MSDTSHLLTDIRIVLVEPSHPGNIGAVARAMMNMSLGALVLVRPRQFPHPEATARASGAEVVLANVRVVESVRDAIADCGFIAATTSRERDQNFRVQDAREAAARLVVEAARAPAAVLFGAERTGLTNDDLEQSHLLVRIPADQAYASLNLAMAVQIMAYELFLARADRAGAARGGACDSRSAGPAGAGRTGTDPALTQSRSTPLATPEEMERLYAHLAEVMDEVGFRDRTQSGTHLMGRIRRFLQRAELDHNEANILRGLLTAVQGRRRPAADRSSSA